MIYSFSYFKLIKVGLDYFFLSTDTITEGVSSVTIECHDGQKAHAPS